jgi:hypothetical protein
MKNCTDCNEEKSLGDFTYDKSRSRHLSKCRTCMAKRTNAYRLKNMDKWRNDSKKHNIKWKEVVDNWKSQGCAKCGESRLHLIDAHHTDPELKDFSVGTTMRGIEITKLELEKCIPLCSNCHRDFHYQEKTQNVNLKDYLIL